MRDPLFKIFTIITAIIVSNLSAQPGFSESIDQTDQEAQRTLDQVTTLGRQYDLDSPRTGELLVRPVLLAKRRNESTVTGFELVFAAVEVAEDGSIVPYTDKPKERFRVKGVTPILEERGRLQASIPPSSYPVASIDLPGGTYTLSEVHYTYFQPFRSNRLAANGDTLSIPELRPERTSFCLSERSFIFDVANGEVSYLGTVALADLPANPGRNRLHEPIFGIDQNPGIPGVESKVDPEVLLVDLADTSFDSEAGICTTARYNVAGWTPRD